MSQEELTKVGEALTLAESLLAAAADCDWATTRARYQASEALLKSAIEATGRGSKGAAYRLDRLVWMWVRRMRFGFPDGRWDHRSTTQRRAWLPLAVLLSCQDAIARCVGLVEYLDKPATDLLVNARIDTTDRLIAVHEFVW